MRWKKYERQKAKKHKGRHIGGPGRPDYVRGKIKGEVKHRQNPLTKPELMKLTKKDVKEIESLSGYTKPAIEYAQRYRPDLKLFRKSKPIKKMRRT